MASGAETLGWGNTVAKGRLTFATLIIPSNGDSGSAASNGGGHHHGGPFPAADSSSGGHGGGETYFLRYGLNRRTDVGLGYWSDPGKPRLAVNWQVAQEAKGRPAMLVGYGSEPMGAWADDGVYVSLIRGFGGGSRRTRAFLGYFREIDGETNHLIGGVSQPLTQHWSLFVGRYPFNAWHANVTYQIPGGVQLGVWAHDFGRSPRLGFSVGAGVDLGGRAKPVRPPAPEETASQTPAPSAADPPPNQAATSP